MMKHKKLYSLKAVERAAEKLESCGYDVEIIEGSLLDSMVFFPPDNEHYYFVAEETYVNCWSSAYSWHRYAELPKAWRDAIEEQYREYGA